MRRDEPGLSGWESIRLLSHLNTEPFLWLDAAGGSIRKEKWGRHLSPLVCYSCRAQMGGWSGRRITGSSCQRRRGWETREEKRVLWVWGTQAPLQPERFRSLPHGSNEDSSPADTFGLIMAPEAKGVSPPRKLTHSNHFCAWICSWVCTHTSMFTPAHVGARGCIRGLPQSVSTLFFETGCLAESADCKFN